MDAIEALTRCQVGLQGDSLRKVNLLLDQARKVRTAPVTRLLALLKTITPALAFAEAANLTPGDSWRDGCGSMSLAHLPMFAEPALSRVTSSLNAHIVRYLLEFDKGVLLTNLHFIDTSEQNFRVVICSWGGKGDQVYMDIQHFDLTRREPSSAFACSWPVSLGFFIVLLLFYLLLPSLSVK